MAIRTGMTGVVGVVRELIADAGTAQFTDVQLQTILDRNRTEARYSSLSPVPTIASGGAVTYSIFDAPNGNWEGTAGLSLLDGSYATLAPGTATDVLAGRFDFGTVTPQQPVSIVGWSYDVYAAAADACEDWAASVKARVDVADADQKLSLSQMFGHLTAQAARYRAMQILAPQFQGRMTRSDMNPIHTPDAGDWRDRRASRWPQSRNGLQ